MACVGCLAGSPARIIGLLPGSTSLMDYSSLTPGYRFPSRAMAMDAAAVDQYRQAVGDSTLPGYVPPTALAAWALGAVLKHLELVPGTVHASQELSFAKAARVGDGVVQSATVAQNSVRGGWRWLVVDLTTEDDQAKTLLSGRSTVLFPES